MQGICRYGKTLSTAFEKVINRKGVKKLVDSGHNFGENLRNFAKCIANHLIYSDIFFGNFVFLILVCYILPITFFFIFANYLKQTNESFL